MARPVLSISEHELLDALAGAMAESNGPEEAKTVNELMAEKNMARVKVMMALRVLDRQGRLACFRVKRRALDGVDRFVPAYTVRAKATK